MTKNELPPDGHTVLFSSTSPNMSRRELNGSLCTILSRTEMPDDPLVTHNYPEGVAVEVRLPYNDTEPRHNGGTTWASLTEIHLVPTQSPAV